MEGDLHGIDILVTSCYITTLIWMSQKVVCWRAGFSQWSFLLLFILAVYIYYPGCIEKKRNSRRKVSVASVKCEV